MELRPYYYIFDDFVLISNFADEAENVREVCWMYECAVLSIIHKYLENVRPITLESLMHCMDLYITNMVPNDGIK